MSFEELLTSWLFVNTLSGAVSAFAASRWGREPFGWLLIGLIFGPIGVALLVVMHLRDGADARPSLRSGRTEAPEPGDTHILLAVDGSPQSDRALDFVVGQFKHSAVRVTVVTVLPIESAAGADAPPDALRRKALEESIARQLGTVGEALTAAGLVHNSVVRFGAAAEEIVELANELSCDLIVLGRRGHGAAPFLLGSVSQRVVSEATRPVTAVG